MPDQHWIFIISESSIQRRRLIHTALQPFHIGLDQPGRPNQIDVKGHRCQRHIGRLQYFVYILYRRIFCITISPTISPTPRETLFITSSPPSVEYRLNLPAMLHNICEA